MKNLTIFLLNVEVISIVLTSILPSVFSNSWFIDILSSFKLQIVIVALLLFILNLFGKKSKIIGGILLIITAWNISFFSSLMYPKSFGIINKEKGISIVSVNLLSSNSDSKKVLDFIKTNDPDVLILLEYNPKWRNLLSEATNQYHFTKTEIRNDNFGIGYFSNIESEISILNFDNTRVPSVRADLVIDESPLTVIATHPLPPVGQQRFELRNLHLKNIGQKRSEFSENLIVVGDLNTSSYSKHFNDLLEKTNLNDSRIGFGILPTWPSNFLPLQTALDHFLISEHIYVLKRKVGNTIGSDHLPIFMEFRIIEKL